MWIYVAVMGFWVVVVVSSQFLFTSGRQRRYLRPAHSLKEIRSVEYYRRLSPGQFESLALQGLRARGFVFLGDPCLGRTTDQGYAWKKGKKVLLSYRLSRPLNAEQLHEIEKRMLATRAESVLVFSPLPETPDKAPYGVEIIAGKKLLKWFSILEDIAPPIAVKSPAEKCVCGAAMNDRVSRAGLPLLVCSMSPDCRVVKRPEERSSEMPRAAAGHALPA